jgi:hypothetical protein
MKLVSLTLGIAVAASLQSFAADEPKTPRSTRAAEPPAIQKEKPRILTLETPAAQPGQKGAAPAAGPTIPNLQFVPAPPPGNAARPPGAALVPAPGENTGPAITVNDQNAPVAPGIYLATPYTGIVVVPAPADAEIFKPEPRNASKMPTAAPDLRLIPKTK